MCSDCPSIPTKIRLEVNRRDEMSSIFAVANTDNIRGSLLECTPGIHDNGDYDPREHAIDMIDGHPKMIAVEIIRGGKKVVVRPIKKHSRATVACREIRKMITETERKKRAMLLHVEEKVSIPDETFFVLGNISGQLEGEHPTAQAALEAKKGLDATVVLGVKTQKGVVSTWLVEEGTDGVTLPPPFNIDTSGLRREVSNNFLGRRRKQQEIPEARR
jgi:virulence-associated protein VagC